MGRVAAFLVLAGLLLTGCASGATTDCRGRAGEITVCVNGKRIPFAEQFPPHRHEEGSIYVPVDPLAQRLGIDVRWIMRGDGQSAIVTVNGRPFAPAMAHGAQGVHVHEGQIYVPLREFAAAAGIQLDMNAEAGVAGFAR